MFSIGTVLKMFGPKLEKIIDDKGGSLSLPLRDIEAFLVKEKIPFKLALRKDGNVNIGYINVIVITKREP